METRWTRIEGSATPLGATWSEQDKSYNFALYSRFATGVTLQCYAEADLHKPVAEFKLHYLRNKTGRVWHVRVPEKELKKARFYAYRVDGPFDPDHGHRFDFDKVLLDPYAKGVFFPPEFSTAAATKPGRNEGQAPLGILPTSKPRFAWGREQVMKHTHDLVIYEMHVRGFTRHTSSGVADAHRGTFAGVIDKIPYLKELGVTAVELMPVHQFDPSDGNYWGYMTLNFFSPHHLYASDQAGALDEFKAMVKALHEADIEVIMDVVYNHTAEGDQRGPNFSFRGIDNRTYYLLSHEMKYYRNDTGCGNTLHTANPYVHRMVVDSLRFWAHEMRVDGFRFDLASIFTRNSDGSINLENPPIIAEISSDPDFSNVRLIAEAWDLGSYQLGRNFPGLSWMQWNGRYRDTLRRFIKGDEGVIGDLATRIYGSDDLFPDDREHAYHAYQSINYVCSHDGFSMYDLVSYNHKHNEANGNGNTDGTDDNHSWNHGWEGEDGVPADVMLLRKRQVKNICALLMLSNGVPMILAGDEFLNTQQGNNNPYNQDNPTTWLNWDRLTQHADVFRFFQKMIAYRKDTPTIGRSRYWREDIAWFGPLGQPDFAPWVKTLAFHLKGASQGGPDLYVMINSHWEAVPFTVQVGQFAEWKRVVDTSLPSPDDIVETKKRKALKSATYALAPRSVVVLQRNT